MEVNYGAGTRFSLGIEEELQLVHRESYELVSRFDEVLAAAGRDERIQPELMRSMIESATHPSASVAEAIEQARAMRARLRDAAAEQDARIVSAGTHPFSRYEYQEPSEAPQFAETHERMAWVAEREVVFGLHVHVGIDSAEAAVQVVNALRTRLPELLALSANSPFWQGRDTGLASARSKVSDAFPRSGLPPLLESFGEFEELVERGVKTNCFPSYTALVWDARPHPEMGTVEVRVCDAQTRLESVAAIAALVQSLVATLVERYEREGALSGEPDLLVEENKWRAARHGLDGKLIDFERDEERPAREAVLAFAEAVAPAARRLGCAEELAEVERACARGSGADEQRRLYEESGSLLAVAQWLGDQTLAGV